MVVSLLFILMILWIVPIYAIVDAARRPDAAWRETGNNRALWIVLLVVFGILAALAYFVAIRPRLIVAARPYPM